MLLFLKKPIFKIGYRSERAVKALINSEKDKVIKAMVAAMEGAVIDSPRGQWVLSSAHNPVQNFYLRQVRNGRNEMVRVAMENLADPAKGCSA